jgi:hypothetical protein
MRRRDLVKYVGGATAWLGCVSFAPATVRAQKRVPVVGILLFGGAGDPRDIGFVRELAGPVMLKGAILVMRFTLPMEQSTNYQSLRARSWRQVRMSSLVQDRRWRTH